LDTNIAIAYLNNETIVRQKLQSLTLAKAFLPSIALGELYYGAKNSTRASANIIEIKEFVAITTVIPCNEGTAEQYGDIRKALKLKGPPLPENDIWIAAIARQHDLTLVTRDDHFKEIDALKMEKW